MQNSVGRSSCRRNGHRRGAVIVALRRSYNRRKITRMGLLREAGGTQVERLGADRALVTHADDGEDLTAIAPNGRVRVGHLGGAQALYW